MKARYSTFRYPPQFHCFQARDCKQRWLANGRLDRASLFKTYVASCLTRLAGRFSEGSWSSSFLTRFSKSLLASSSSEAVTALPLDVFGVALLRGVAVFLGVALAGVPVSVLFPPAALLMPVMSRFLRSFWIC